eukprot:366490-Chlamydomonas_euryale.AAC.27
MHQAAPTHEVGCTEPILGVGQLQLRSIACRMAASHLHLECLPARALSRTEDPADRCGVQQPGCEGRCRQRAYASQTPSVPAAGAARCRTSAAGRCCRHLVRRFGCR